MKPAEIRGALVAREITNRAIARECKVTPTMISYVIKGKRKPLYIREAIAHRLDLDVRDIWLDEVRHLAKER
jgi:predicted transcriptional regulator